MIVIKIGGSLGTEVQNLAKEIVEISKKERVVVVHGGSYETTEISKNLGRRQNLLHPFLDLDQDTPILKLFK